MYNIFKNNTINYLGYYFSYEKEDKNKFITTNKLKNIMNKIKNDNNEKTDDFIASIPDENVFLTIFFSYNINLYPMTELDQNFETYLKYNLNYYTKYNNIKTKQLISEISNNTSSSIFNEYKRYKENEDTKNLFGEKYSNFLVFNDTDFFNCKFMFLNNNKLTTISDDYIYNHNDLYFVFNEYDTIKGQKNKYYINFNLTYGKSIIELKNILNLKKQDYYLMSFSRLESFNFVYSNLFFIRAKDFSINIKKYSKIFKLSDNDKLKDILFKLREQSLNNFKEACNKQYQNINNVLNKKMNFINSIDFSKMHIH